MHRWLLLAVSALLLSTLTRRVLGHDPFELTTNARLAPSELRIETTATRGCALALIDPARPSGAAFSPADLPRLRPRLEAAGGQLFELTQQGRRLSPLRVTAELTHEHEMHWSVVYPTPAPGELVVRAKHLESLGPSYASAITFTQDDPAAVLGTAVFAHDAPELAVVVLGRAPASAPAVPHHRSQLGFGRSFWLGIEHILEGFDHLSFLAGVLIACRRVRAMLAIVTAFTLAHSITLGLAALEIVSLPASLVEPLIAASIALVGVENLLRKDAPPRRAAVCFAFGLVHGFGFAGALRELGLGRPGSPLVLPLLGFNLGVEAGQLLVVGVLFPLLLLLRGKPRLSRVLLPAASLGVTAAGIFWLLERTLLS